MAAGPPARGERRAAAAGAALAVVTTLALVAGALWLLGPGTRPAARAPQPSPAPTHTTPPTPTVEPAVLRLQALDTLLAERAQAVLQRDRTGWLATVDPRAAEFAAQQEAVFDNLAHVPLADWRYDYVGQGPALPADRQQTLGPDAWVARVVLAYQLQPAPGTDVGEVRREQYLTLVRRGPRWQVAADTDGASAPDLWDLAPVQVAHGKRSLVLGTADVEELRRYAQETDDAARHVDQVWGTAWPRTVVVMVPRTQTEMARLLLRDSETGLEQIAAVTTGEIGMDEQGTSADRVIINPAGFAQLGPLGRRVVLSHEITHVATRATTTQDVPIWLSEGFADYVAYRDTGLSRAVIAQDLLDQVRAGQLPAGLPQEGEFDPAHREIAPAYSGAWLANELIARRWGEPAVVELYRAVADGASTETAVQQVLGTDQATFTEQWRAYLEDLAS
jgi:hypothetical protein